MLVINNADVEKLLTMKGCIEVQEAAFAAADTGLALQRPKIDFYAPSERQRDGYFRWGTMEGWYDGLFSIRLKADIVTWPRHPNGGWTEEKYCVEPGTYCGLVMLFSSDNGEPLAMINDGFLQHMRVGAGAGIGVKHLARKDATTVGMLGSGGMARHFLEAFCEVRPIKSCKVFSPTRANREAYAAEMSAQLGIEVVAVESAEEAVRGVDILSTATTSMAPTIDPAWLEPGMHIAMLGPFEISQDVLARCEVKISQGAGGVAMAEAPRIRKNIGMSSVAWIAGTAEQQKRLPPPTPSPNSTAMPDFCDLVHGRAQGRTSDQQITYYHNLGNQGLQFASVAGLAYRAAVAQGVGYELPTGLFIQDIRN